MRTLVLACIATLALAAALPAVEARGDACVGLKNLDCPGAVCVDADGDGRYVGTECASADRCEFQSDCCAATGFWCPETD